MSQVVVASLIGDVVASRRSSDRAALQYRLRSLLSDVGRHDGVDLEMTLGDEFQGRYPSLQSAIASSLRLHLGAVGAPARLRIGIGWGEVVVESVPRSPFDQDGPAWWRARDAIERAADLSDGARTVVDTSSEWDEMINAYLTLRDAVLDGFDTADAVIALGLLDGTTQRSLAERLGLHESSVSRRVGRHGIAHLVGAAAPPIPGFGAGS